MSIASDPLGFRRAAFRDALRRGDPLAAARTAARLNAHAGELTALEFAAARAARLGLGRAIRDARSRRTTIAPSGIVSAAQVPRRSRSALLALGLAIVMLAAALSSWLVVPRDVIDDLLGGGSPAVAPDAAAPITAQSRGRVVVAVAAAPVEQPKATIAPQPVTVIAPAVGTSGPSAVPGSVGSPGPVGSGSPGPGNGTGSPSASPAASPTPTSARPTPLPPLPRGFARLSGQVVDSRTGRGLPDACVSLGPCTPVSTRTDANGRWTIDLPVGTGRLDWGLEYAKDGYAVLGQTVRSRTGFILLGVQRLLGG